VPAASARGKAKHSHRKADGAEKGKGGLCRRPPNTLRGGKKAITGKQRGGLRLELKKKKKISRSRKSLFIDGPGEASGGRVREKGNGT